MKRLFKPGLQGWGWVFFFTFTGTIFGGAYVVWTHSERLHLYGMRRSIHVTYPDEEIDECIADSSKFRKEWKENRAEIQKKYREYWEKRKDKAGKERASVREDSN